MIKVINENSIKEWYTYFKWVAEKILNTHDDKQHSVPAGYGEIFWSHQLGGGRYLVTIYNENNDFERFWIYESSTVDDACKEISKAYDALFFEEDTGDVIDVSDISFKMSNFSKSEDDWDEDLILKVINNTEYPITCKSGYSYYNSGKSAYTLSKYQAKKVIKNNSFVDVDCKNGELFINTYSENDMW